MIDDRPKKRGWKSRMVTAFNEVAAPVKEVIRDSRTMEALDQLDGDALLENSSVLLKHLMRDGGANNEVTIGFLEHYQKILGATQLSANDRKRLAAKLDHDINAYAANLAADRQVLHGLRNLFKPASDSLENVGVERFKEVTPLIAELDKAGRILERLTDKVEHKGGLTPDDDLDVALVRAALGGINAAGLSNFSAPADATARSMAFEQRAIANPGSDTARMAGAIGGLLRTRAMALFQRQADAGMDFTKLGEREELSEEEALALYVYTDFDYEPMNNCLITGGKDLDRDVRAALETKIEFCKRGLAKLPSYPRELYPVVRWENDSSYWRGYYQVNKVFRNLQFWSTGATAGAQIKQPTDLQLIFRVYGLSGKDVAMLSSKQGEGANQDQARPEARLGKLGQGEVLFTPQTPFKVISISEEPQPGGRTFVYITVMEQPQ